MRKLVKVLHTVSASGLIGGLGCYMLILAIAPQDTPVAYAGMRAVLAAIGNYVLFPSLAVAVISGLLSMMVHTPFLDKGWVWMKALMGVIMIKGVLLLVVVQANRAADAAKLIAEGEEVAHQIPTLAAEWSAVGIFMALSVASVVFGIWRPRRIWPSAQAETRAEDLTAETGLARDKQTA